jgi:poly-gamma-glutamate synthesis protein (capsule biosynthesis protein)
LILLFFPFSVLLFCLSACRSRPAVINLALLGDINLGRGVSPAPDSLAFLAPELKAADIAFANLESPLGRGNGSVAPYGGYDLCAPAERANLLAAWGFDLLSIANNHRFDCSPDGPSETAAILRATDIYPVASGLDSVYWNIPGLKLAFLAYDDVASPLDEKAAVQEIWQAHAYGALVVVSVHWGAEYQAAPTERQKTLANRFAQAGAVLIVGSHPHVLQTAEWIPTGEGKTLVLYSLGNALFDQPGLPDTRRSALVVVRLDAGGVRSVRAVPFVIDTAGSRVVAPDAAAAALIHNDLHIP